MKSWYPVGEYGMHADGDYHKMDTSEAVYFYEQEFYVLSNFSAFQVCMNGTWHQTAEHLYHYLKFVPELPAFWDGCQSQAIQSAARFRAAYCYFL